MGREIRIVPPNWEHPRTNRYCDGRYQPMFDENYDESSKKWIENFKLFIEGKHPKQESIIRLGCKYYWEYDDIPNEETCRPYKDDECSWFQVYETVSAGTPVTPPFSTKKELVEYLVNDGDFLIQKNGEGGYSREAAESFVYGGGYAPYFVFTNGEMLESIESYKLK